MIATNRPLRSQVRKTGSAARRIEITRVGGSYGQLGYRSAKIATSEGRSYSMASGDSHTEYDRIKLIAQSREFLRDNAIYKGMIERAVSYIVGNGFGLQVTTASKSFNASAEKVWKEFWKKPDIRNLLPGRRLERMICREMFVAGDTGIIKTSKKKLQLIEAEQIAGKRNSGDGIEKDDFGKPTKYLVCPYNKRGQVTSSAPTEYDPENFIFITDPERPSSTRGVPPCQASFPMLHRINDVCDSEAIAWQMLARIAVSITRKEGAKLAWNESKADSDTEGDLATRLTELGYAMIFHGEEGEEIKGIDRNIPGKNFSESLLMFLRLLGLPLGLPLEVILLDWTKSNYSQSRAVLEQAYQTFLGWQYLLIDCFYSPVYEWVISNSGIQLPKKDGLKHDWIKPTFPWIDQLKEAQAYAAKLDRGFVTHAQVCKSLNYDRDDIVAARVAEITEAIGEAQKIEKQTGQKVPWQIFCGLAETPSAPAVETDADKDEKNKEDGDNPDGKNNNQ